MSMLKHIRSGRIDAPYKALVYGTEGVGKSSFAANAERPIFMCLEDGTESLEVDRLPEMKSLDDVYSALEELGTEEHLYQTLVIDSVDWLAPLVEDAVCKRNGWKSIEDPGYGKGPNVANEEWRRFLARMEELRKRKKMHVLLIGHAEIKRFNDPAGSDFDRYQLKLPPKAAAVIKEWSDAVLFAEYETATKKDGGRVKGVATGNRIIHTERQAAFDAKNRWGLPPTLPLDFAAFDAGRRANADQKGELDRLLEEVDSEKAKVVRDWIEKQPNKSAALAASIARLREAKEKAA